MPRNRASGRRARQARQGISSYRELSNSCPEWVRVTDREWKVVNLIAEGMSNKAIARRLRISIHMVKSHVRNTMEKPTLIASPVHRHSDVARPNDLSQ